MKAEETCHGCGNKFDNCICEELDAEMNEGKYPDDDPNDGHYSLTGNELILKKGKE